MGPCGLEVDSITESEDVVVLFVLQGVLVDVDQTLRVSETSFGQEIVGLGWRGHA